MYPIPGHLACGLAIRVSTGLSLPIILTASLLPDVADKVLCDVLHWTPYGRTLFHSIPTLVLLSAAWAVVLKERKAGLAWAGGHFAHLLADLPFVPWWYPFVSYDWPDSPNITQATFELRYLFSGDPRVTDLVRQVFIPMPLFQETLLLLLVGGFWYVRDRPYPFRTVLATLFLIIAAWRVHFLFF